MSKTTGNELFFPFFLIFSFGFFFGFFFFYIFWIFPFPFFLDFSLILKRRIFFTFHHTRVFLPLSRKLFRTSAFSNFTTQKVFFFKFFYHRRVLKYQILPHKGFKFHHTRVLKLYHTKVLKWYHKGF